MKSSIFLLDPIFSLYSMDLFLIFREIGKQNETKLSTVDMQVRLSTIKIKEFLKE